MYYDARPPPKAADLVEVRFDLTRNSLNNVVGT